MRPRTPPAALLLAAAFVSLFGCARAQEERARAAIEEEFADTVATLVAENDALVRELVGLVEEHEELDARHTPMKREALGSDLPFTDEERATLQKHRDWYEPHRVALHDSQHTGFQYRKSRDAFADARTGDHPGMAADQVRAAYEEHVEELRAFQQEMLVCKERMEEAREQMFTTFAEHEQIMARYE